MNTKKTVLATLLAALAVSPLAVTPVSAQSYAQVQAPAMHMYTQAELDQMLAPIALYPDALLSQILMAATYPIEVVEAARWSRAHPRLQGDDAVRAVHNEDWDPSVKSLVAFPQILERMDERLEWTRTLGDAFLAQEPQMMDQVQLLRRRAQAAGHLYSSEQIRVEHQGPVIIVRQASPEYIYVPYYDPMEVYGTWMWPAYRPVAWSPWPGYSRGYHRPGVSVGFWWGRPVGLSLGFFFGDFDWGRRHTHVAHSNSYYYRAPAYRSVTAERGRWQHDPQHRRAVAYRSSEVRQRFASAQTERRDDRQAARQQAQPAATLQAQPQAVIPAQRAERREDRRDERRAERQAAPAAAATPAQPAAQTRADRREDRRAERQAERQAAPAVSVAPSLPAAQPRAEQRDDRRAERQAAMEAQRQARQQVQQQQAREQAQAAQRQAQDTQRQAQQQAQQAQRQAQQQAQEAQRQAQQQAQQKAQQQARSPQPAPTMPAAQAPQTPRAERQEQREERREKRREQREAKG